MPPKALSSSTLSLRFMQNAEQKHTVQQAKVRDDAEWELPQDLRSTTVGEDTVTYEHSYLPFLFDQPRGRRTFDKHGKEVSRLHSLFHCLHTQPGLGFYRPTSNSPAPRRRRRHHKFEKATASQNHLFIRIGCEKRKRYGPLQVS